MKKLLKKLFAAALNEIEAGLIASAWMHEVGFSPLEGNYLYPVNFYQPLEKEYFDMVSRVKMIETTEPVNL